MAETEPRHSLSFAPLNLHLHDSDVGIPQERQETSRERCCTILAEPLPGTRLGGVKHRCHRGQVLEMLHDVVHETVRRQTAYG